MHTKRHSKSGVFFFLFSFCLREIKKARCGNDIHSGNSFQPFEDRGMHAAGKVWHKMNE